MDLTKDCKIEFTEAVFIGNYPKAKFSHERTIIGIIINDSYGTKTGQHTFTIEVENCDDLSINNGEKIKRKGRNVYPKCKILELPINHLELAEDKHERSKSIKDGIYLNKMFNSRHHDIYEN